MVIKTFFVGGTGKKVLLAVAGLLVLAACGYMIFERARIDPPNLLGQALKNTISAESYDYSVQSVLTVDRKERPLSQITGKRDSQGNFYIQGVMLKQGVEVYQIDDTTYFKDEQNNKWMVMNNNNIMEMQQFVTEINPLSNFSFVVPSEVQYEGKERVNGHVCYRLTCMPHVENQVLELQWKNFKYDLWVDRGKKLISRAVMKAESKENPNSILTLEVELKNFNHASTISAPEVEKEQ